jgi:hypothetical protein
LAGKDMQGDILDVDVRQRAEGRERGGCVVLH